MSNRIPETLPSLARTLRLAGYKAGELYKQFLDDHDLPLQQWVVLTALWRQDGLSIGEIAQYTSTGKAAISRIIGRMEAAELVERRSGTKDSRSVGVWLTEKSKALDELIDVYERVNDILLKDFDDEERAQLRGYLARILNNASKE